MCCTKLQSKTKPTFPILHVKKTYWHISRHFSNNPNITLALMLGWILAGAPWWGVFCHVSYMEMLLFPESWNSSYSSMKGLIESVCKNAPLYESARKAERGTTKAARVFQSTWQWGDNISVPPHHRKDNRVTRMTHAHTDKNPHTDAHAHTRDQLSSDKTWPVITWNHNK